VRLAQLDIEVVLELLFARAVGGLEYGVHRGEGEDIEVLVFSVGWLSCPARNLEARPVRFHVDGIRRAARAALDIRDAFRALDILGDGEVESDALTLFLELLFRPAHALVEVMADFSAGGHE